MEGNEGVEGAEKPIVLSVDAMGGDEGPAPVIDGMAKSAAKNARIRFLLHGPEDTLAPLVEKQGLTDRVEIRNATGVVSMSDKPAHVMRHGQDTSMWSCIEAVRSGEARAAVSCGNTGALMLLSMVRLKKMPGVRRPAIAVLWPAQTDNGFNVMLDVGADIKADPSDLLTYALMGAAYARNGQGIERPRVGLLNNGTEDNKGRPEMQEAHDLISSYAERGDYTFEGFVEGGDIPTDTVDVIVTDGFTGNVALKTAEGTATLFRNLLKEAFAYSILSRMAAVLAYTSLKRLQKRIDPRRVNGGVFLGLNGTVVKSHGSSDPTGVSAAIKLAFRLGMNNFDERLAARVAIAEAAHDEVPTKHVEDRS